MRRGNSRYAQPFVEPVQTDFVEPTLEELLNEQVKNEMYAAYLYTALSAWCDNVGLEGYAHWFEVQSQEELGHAKKVLDFLVETGSPVNLRAVDAPMLDIQTALDAANAALQHEKKVTQDWQRIGDAARELRNMAADQLAKWFINEQIEEEDNAVKLVQRTELAGEGAGLLVLDQELAQRE
jgi:ferritin